MIVTCMHSQKRRISVSQIHIHFLNTSDLWHDLCYSRVWSLKRTDKLFHGSSYCHFQVQNIPWMPLKHCGFIFHKRLLPPTWLERFLFVTPSSGFVSRLVDPGSWPRTNGLWPPSGTLRRVRRHCSDWENHSEALINHASCTGSDLTWRKIAAPGEKRWSCGSAIQTKLVLAS